MAGRPVPAESTRASMCDALVPPSPPPLTWMRPVPRSPSTPASAARSRLHRLADQPLHGRELLRCRLGALRCRLAHHIAANAGMADQGPDIDAALLAQRV